MKNFVKSVGILCLILLTVIPACAEPSAVLKNIFETFTAEDSQYSQMKSSYAEYAPDTKFEETLNDDSFTITVSGDEYMNGSWTFVQDGDYLVLTTPAGDFYGSILTSYLIDAVGVVYDMNLHLLHGYINGISLTQMENDYFIITNDKGSGDLTARVYIAGPYDMKELDQMVLDEKSLSFDPLNENYVSNASSCGKLLMIANGNVDDVSILLGEFGELDDLAYRSILSIVSVLKPKGWEAFTADYKELADADGKGYTVTLKPDQAVIDESIYEDRSDYAFMLVHFGE